MDMAIRAVMSTAELQHGVISSRQMNECGLSRSRQQDLIRLGILIQVFRGVFAVAGRPFSRWSEAVAASLACGPRAVLSHTTAAAIHAFPAIPDGRLAEVSVGASRHPRPRGVVTHRAATLDRPDIEERNGILLTSAARTLVDLSPRYERHDLGRLLDEGVIKRLWTLDDVGDASVRAGVKGKAGGAQLRSLLAERSGEQQVESHLEMRVLRLLTPFRPFETNFQFLLEGDLISLDVAWPARMAALESDGFGSHGLSRTKFDRDRRKGNLLLLHGWRVAHVTSTMPDDLIISVVRGLLRER